MYMFVFLFKSNVLDIIMFGLTAMNFGSVDIGAWVMDQNASKIAPSLISIVGTVVIYVIVDPACSYTKSKCDQEHVRAVACYV